MKLFWKQPYKTLKPNYMTKFICDSGESGLGIYSSKNNRKKNHILTADAWVSGPDLAPQKFFILSQQFRHLMRCKKYLENFFSSWLVSLFGPLAAILNFAQKCKQTAVSQKLSKIKKNFQDIFCISLLGPTHSCISS